MENIPKWLQSPSTTILFFCPLMLERSAVRLTSVTHPGRRKPSSSQIASRGLGPEWQNQSTSGTNFIEWLDNIYKTKSVQKTKTRTRASLYWKPGVHVFCSKKQCVAGFRTRLQASSTWVLRK